MSLEMSGKTPQQQSPLDLSLQPLHSRLSLLPVSAGRATPQILLIGVDSIGRRRRGKRLLVRNRRRRFVFTALERLPAAVELSLDSLSQGREMPAVSQIETA